LILNLLAMLFHKIRQHLLRHYFNDSSLTIRVQEYPSSATYVDVNDARQRVLGVGATFDGDTEYGLGLLDGDSEVTLLVRYDDSTLHPTGQHSQSVLMHLVSSHNLLY